MLQWLIERQLTDVSKRLRSAREEVQVLDEQLAFVSEEADDLRIRALLSETPQATSEHTMGQRHVDSLTRARADLLRRITELETKQDSLLDRISAK